jgi:hypothetical protein
LPDGPLANRPFHYVRRRLIQSARIETIVSLPRGIHPTTAETSILIAKKHVPTFAQSNFSDVCARVGVWSSIATVGTRGFISKKNRHVRRAGRTTG